MYYRRANAALVVFDITREKSFDEAKEWVRGRYTPSLVPRPFGGGAEGEKTAWYTLSAHASKCTQNPGTP